MVTSLSNLVEMMRRGAIPAWLRDYFVANRDEIVKTLREKGVYTFNSPDGERISIRAEKAAAA